MLALLLHCILAPMETMMRQVIRLQEWVLDQIEMGNMPGGNMILVSYVWIIVKLLSLALP